jgi:hypothetical protein
MKKFMVLYMASAADFEKAMQHSTPDQHKKGMDAWMKWMEKHKKSTVDGGAPLGKTKRVDAKGASNTKNYLQMMPGGWIEIVEIMPIPGM